jgi:SCP-2 sterol transfer family protein
VKAWQTARDPDPAKPTDPGALIQHMLLSFRLKARFWSALGRSRPRICQFALENGAIDRWFVEIDGEGGHVKPGSHARPDATWSSDAASLVELMRGEAGPELLSAGRVRITGDPDVLIELFTGLNSRV